MSTGLLAVLFGCDGVSFVSNARQLLCAAGFTALGMVLALPEGGVLHACDIAPQYPAIGRYTPASQYCSPHPFATSNN